MKSRFYVLILCVLAALQTFAQCDGARYKDQVFSAVSKSTVKYSTPYNLSMDIYQPTGDTAPMRPVMLLAHGGSFLVGSTKSNDAVVNQLCNNYAKRGYVAVSIDYRVAGYFDMLDSAKAVQEVLKAISDGKAAIRYFKQDAATNNTYRVDPDKIFVGGNSAGAVLFMHVMNLDSLEEAPLHFQNEINANGGFEGNSGNPGYSTEVAGLLNLAGGLNDPYFVGPGSKPSFNAHGDADATVPYNCAYAQGGITPVRLCGLGAIQPLYDQFSIYHKSIVYAGKGHCPWQNEAALMTDIDTSSTNFFYSILCENALSINTVNSDSKVKIYPNPANNQFNISFDNAADFSKVQLTEITGRVIEEKTVAAANVSFQRNNLPAGIYMAVIHRNDGRTITHKISFE